MASMQRRGYNSSSMLILVILYLTTFVISHQIPLQAPLSSPHSAFTTTTTTTTSDSSFLSSLPKPSRPLQWGTLNILSTTDIHGWLRGHTHHDHIPESLYSGSIADVASFREHMQAKADQLGVDLLLVDSGDVVDGNGFVDADNSGFKGHAAREVLKLVEYDIATTGNHELYNYTVALDVYKSYIPSLHGKYLSSNILISTAQDSKPVPFGNKYLKFKTKNQKLNITAFGVLFGFDRADKGLNVIPPLEMIKEEWWKDVLEKSGDTDVFILLGHMATRDKDWLVVLNSIRALYPTKPVLIFSGHAHVRDCIRPDPYTQVLASGRYMETLGFSSLTLPSHSSPGPSKPHPLFTSITAAEDKNPYHLTRRYLDNNLASYIYHSNTSLTTFQTSKGKTIQSKMDEFANGFNLSFTFGYAPQSYYLDRYPITHQKSLIKLYADKVFNTVVVEQKRKPKNEESSGDSDSPIGLETDTIGKKIQKYKGPQPAFLFNTGGARFDIFKGPFTVDDQFTVIPFDNAIWSVSTALPYELVVAVVEWLNNMAGEPELYMELSVGKKIGVDAKIDDEEKVEVEVEKVEDKVIDEAWLRKNMALLVDSMAASEQRRNHANQYRRYLSSIAIDRDRFPANAAAHVNDNEEEEEEDVIQYAHSHDTAEIEADVNVEKNKKKKKKKFTFGYVTRDSCGMPGDDIPHRPLPAYPIPDFVLSTRSEEFNYDSSLDKVHLVFYEFIAPLILSALNDLQNQHTFTYSNLTVYSDLKANELLGEYAKIAWN